MRRMMLAIGTLSPLVLVAQQPSPPTFRSGIDVVRLDITVLDRDRHPVMDLKEGDFTILVEGRRQPIVAFEPVVIPPPERPTTEWMREVAPDVRSNALGDPRLIVIIMDDATTATSPFMVRTAKEIADGIIDQLSPSDLAAVIFTLDNRHAQDFTADHQLLRSAVETFNVGIPGSPIASRYLRRTLEDALKYMRERGHGRSAIMLISANPGTTAQIDASGREAQWTALQGLRQFATDIQDISNGARFTPVPIYGFNIAGLVAPNADIDPAHRVRNGIPAMEPAYTERSAKAANDTLRTLADLTGGRAVVDDNAPARAVPSIFDEMSGYYTLAYRATYSLDIPKAHHLTIHVNRPDVTVLPSERDVMVPKRPKPSTARPPSLVDAISDLLPASNLSMAIAAAPFDIRGMGLTKGPATGVLASVRVRRAAPPDGTRDRIELLAKVFTPEGKDVSTVRQTADLVLQPADADAEIDILTPMAIKPGRYNLRVSAHSDGLDTTGSVYTDVTVPDFARERLSLSGVLVSATPVAQAAPLDAFARIVPVIPTTARTFSTRDRANAFVRVYQEPKTAAPVDIVIRVIDNHGVDTAASARHLDALPFARAGNADVTYELPLRDLAPGSYLLSIKALRDQRTSAERDVRFVVR